MIMTMRGNIFDARFADVGVTMYRRRLLFCMNRLTNIYRSGLVRFLIVNYNNG